MSDMVERARAVHAALNGRSSGAADQAPAELRRLPLPDAHPPRADLVGTMARRRSTYAFDDRPLPLPTLSALLRFSVGVQRFVTAYGTEDYPLGMAPSAGGLLSRQAYMVVREVDQLDAGVYRYDQLPHELVELRADDPLAALETVYDQPEFVPRVSVTVALTAKLDVAFERYPLRHYRTMHVDAGVAVQNLYLVGGALGLACCAVASFDDAALTALLGLPEPEIPTMLFAAGPPG